MCVWVVILGDNISINQLSHCRLIKYLALDQVIKDYNYCKAARTDK